jgi:haloalkane dehalogenase
MARTHKVSSTLYPFQSHYEIIGGHRYHYIEEGRGDTVVMLHGNPSWSFYFRELIQKLSPHYHCLAPDHIGMGYSDKPGDGAYNYTLTQRVKDLEQFLEKKSITGNVTLVMHDWGGAIGMSYARRHPQAIKRIVILNTSAFHVPEGKRLPFFIHFSRSFFGAFFVRAFNSFSAGATLVGVKRIKMSRDVRLAYTAPYNSWKNRIAVLRFIQDIPLKKEDTSFEYVSDLQSHLPLLSRLPVLIAWGMKDDVFDIHFLNKWLEYLPQAEVHRFENCGHYILEDAQQEVGKLIVDFLSKSYVNE